MGTKGREGERRVREGEREGGRERERDRQTRGGEGKRKL